MKNGYRYIILLLMAVFIVKMLLFAVPGAAQVMGQTKGVIVIDAGHGGFDGGAVGCTTNVKEDGLNLCVAIKVQKLLAADGYTVIMTREDENALGQTKNGDMQKRREIIENAHPDIVISIHMNKFSDSYVSGPQVFYHGESAEGEILASLIQEQLNAILDPPKPRTFKPENYFILRSGSAPCVLVECGFLSNEREEQLLQTDEYQNKCANAIFRGAEYYLDHRFEMDITKHISQ